MVTAQQEPRPKPTRIPATAATMAMAVGGLVLLGWLLDVERLRSFAPGATNPTVASIAVALLLCGVALRLVSPEPPPRAGRWIGRVLGVGVAAVGLLKLGEYAFGWDLGIDQTLFVEDPGPFPGEMGLPTAVSLVSVGLSLTLLDVETRRGVRPAQGLAVAGVLLPILSLIGRLYGVPGLSRLVPGTSAMSLPTAVTLVALAVGILGSRPGRGIMRVVTSEGPAGILLRRLLPGAVVAVIGAGWLRLAGERRGYLTPEAGAAAIVIISAVLLAVLIWRSARSLYQADLQRKDAVQRITTSEEHFRAVAENTPDAIITASTTGTVTYFNPGAEAMFGYPAAEVVGQPITILMPDRYHAAHRQGLVRYLATGEPRVIGTTAELEGRRKDGGEFPLELSLSVWNTAEGRSFTGIIRDISARKETEEALRRTQEDAERANRAKSEFLSRMSHELRTPLSSVIGFGQLLEMEEELEPSQRESVEHIIKGGRHLLSLINEVMEISRIETGQLSFSIEPVPVGEVTAEALGLVRQMADERQISVEVDGGRGLTVMADRQRLKQILLNLLSNAVKYNRDGGTVRVATKETGGRVRIEVADSGPGIPVALQDELYSPFNRLGAEATGVEGTGLGLALSKALVEAMGGMIDLDSAEGRGSTFSVELARAKGGETVSVEGEEPQDLESMAETARTVLYIEDNPANLRLVQRVLERRLPGTRVLSATEGRGGFELAREEHPDLILLDLHLPDLPGEKVLQRLKEHPETRDIPVVIVTADAIAGRSEPLLSAGAVAYLTKPLDLRRLLGLVGDLPATRQATGPSGSTGSTA